MSQKILFFSCSSDGSANRLYGAFLGLKKSSCLNFYCRKDSLPSPEQVDRCLGICITGSDEYLSELTEGRSVPWFETLCEIVERVWNQGRLIFGFCFGHQLIAHVLGAKVRRLPRTFAGAQALALTALGSQLLRRDYLVLLGYHSDAVVAISENSPLTSLCRFSNDLCIARGQTGNIQVLISQVHPEFSFRELPVVEADKAVLDPSLSQTMKFYSPMRDDYEHCRRGACPSAKKTYIDKQTFEMHYRYDRDDPNQQYYMLKSSLAMRRLYRKVIEMHQAPPQGSRLLIRDDQSRCSDR